MKYKLIINGLLSSTILLSSTNSYANMPKLNLTPYGGVDVGMQNFGFKAGYGDNLFKKQLPKGNLFAGVKFNDYFGIEGGYESTIDKKKDATVNGNNLFLGTNPIDVLAINPGETAKFSTRTKIYGWHISITGDYPIYFNSKNKKLSIIGTIGIKKTKVKLIVNQYEVLGIPYSNQYMFNTNNKKTLVRVSGGLQHFFNKNFGIRALISWENTSKLKPVCPIINLLDEKSSLQVKLKNSINYSIGFILNCF